VPDAPDEVDLDADADAGAGAGPERGPDPTAPAAGGWATTWPERTPAWMRGPAGALAAAILAAVLAAGLAVHHLRAVATADLAAQQAVAALQVGPVDLDWQGPRGPRGEEVRVMPVRGRVRLLNGGDEPLVVTVLGTSVADARLLGGPGPVRLAAGSGAVVDLEWEADCSALPAPPPFGGPLPGRAARADWVEVAVEGRGEWRRERRLLPSSAGVDLASQLGWMCDPWSAGGASAQLALLDDERLEVRVTNAGAAPVTVDLEETQGLTATSDVELPLTVPSQEQAVLRVALSVECARVAQPPAEPHADAVDVVAVLQEDDGSRSTRGVADPAVMIHWVARQVALACG
jgi:hypothetical protein